MSNPHSVNIINDPNHPGMALMTSFITAINAQAQCATAERPLTAATVLDVLFSLYTQLVVVNPCVWPVVPEVLARLEQRLAQAQAELAASADQQAAAAIARAAANPSTPAP